MEDVSGEVYFQAEAEYASGSEDDSDVITISVVSLGSLEAPDVITGRWLEGNDLNLSVIPDQNTDYYELWVSQGEDVLYDWSDESAEGLEGTTALQFAASSIQAGSCVSLRMVQHTAGMCARETTLSIWPIDSSAVLELPEDLTTLEESAFMGTSSATHVVFPAGITFVGTGAFTGSGVRTFEIPSGAAGFEEGALGSTDITIYGTAGSAAEAYAAEEGISFVRIQ